MNWQDQGKKECPFCRTDASVHENVMELKCVYADCLCGKFIIEQIALEDTGVYNKILGTDEDKILFSGYLRNNQTTTITEVFISEELPGILDYCQRKTLSEKISDIKNYIYQKTTSIGKSVPLEVEKLYTLFYLKTHSELVKLLIYLRDTNILHDTPIDIGPTANVILTVEGFSKIESSLEDYSQSKKVFIACQFKTNYEKDLVETIKAACAACGFDAKRVSDERHDKDITHKIIADINQSRFIIADFTDQNNGVYYEAGYAMGMSKKVIRLINKEQIEKLHYDTRQFNHIQWEKGKWKELEEDLINQIKTTIK